MSDAFNITGAGADLCSQLRARVAACLINNTLAGSNVETCRADAFDEIEPYTIAIYTPKISRTQIGKTPPEYETKVTLAIVARVLAQTKALAETTADKFRVQIEQAVLCNAKFYGAPLEFVPSIETTIHFPAEGEYREAEIAMVLECQCHDEFYPNPTTPLNTIGATIPNATVPPGTAPAENLIGAIITLPQ